MSRPDSKTRDRSPGVEPVAPAPPRNDSELVIPVAAEVLTIEKQSVITGGVRVRKNVVERTETVDEPLWKEELEVTRAPIGQFVDSVPEVRCEGDVTIVPVVEERLVVQKRLWLREEVHIRRRREETRAPQTFTVRRETASVEPVQPEDVVQENTVISNATSVGEE
jgi:uncharacterized protein (TIGR02271 family)